MSTRYSKKNSSFETNPDAGTNMMKKLARTELQAAR
jgi:hypothetical protein